MVGTSCDGLIVLSSSDHIHIPGDDVLMIELTRLDMGCDSNRTNNRKPYLAFSAMAAMVIGLPLLVSGCAGNKSAFSGKGSPMYEGSGPIPRGGGIYKVGNPYKIAGRTYYPREDPTYDKTGLASWYGPKFHKRQTANGEWYDMNALTAAHPTLPLPSYARVTSLRTSKSLVVRINDRGPYAHDRIIDLSRRSAQVLGFEKAGVIKVRVQYLGKAPLEYDDADLVAVNKKYRTRGRPDVLVAEVPKPSRPAVTAATPAVPTDTTGGPLVLGSTNQPAQVSTAGQYYVQAASFSNQDNAMRLQQRLSAIGRVAVDETRVGSTVYYRVRVGPIADSTAASQALEQVMAAGQPDAHVVAN